MSHEGRDGSGQGVVTIEAIADVAQAHLVSDSPTHTISSVTIDSRSVTAGSLYCCIRGERFDGHDFALDAVASGATALLLEHDIDGVPPGVARLVVGDVRSVLGAVSSYVYGEPSRKMTIVGITGTNGKTTTAHLLASILRAGGTPTEVLGTLQGRYTTPEAPDLQRDLAQMVDKGVEALAMEVSSHALAFGRVAGMRFAAGVFTNLGRDHLDFHGTMENYFAAKARLFEPDLSNLGVVNVDDPWGRRLLESATIPMTPFSLQDAHDLDVSVFAHDFTWQGQRLHVGIGGGLNVMNSLAAATTARALGIDSSEIVQGLAEAGPVPGRFERIDEGQDFTVLIDYAHTPDGLSEVLRSVRSIPNVARVILVFGCGGDRDKMKRPIMGEVAVSLADVVIVTSDNPRSEDPEAIIASIVAGVPDHMRQRLWATEPDRAEAIGLACGLARSGDVVLITGKGHESTQTVGAEVLPFDDRIVARDIVRSSR